jgi:hypothetical protein
VLVSNDRKVGRFASSAVGLKVNRTSRDFIVTGHPKLSDISSLLNIRAICRNDADSNLQKTSYSTGSIGIGGTPVGPFGVYVGMKP